MTCRFSPILTVTTPYQHNDVSEVPTESTRGQKSKRRGRGRGQFRVQNHNEILQTEPQQVQKTRSPGRGRGLGRGQKIWGQRRQDVDQSQQSYDEDTELQQQLKVCLLHGIHTVTNWIMSLPYCGPSYTIYIYHYGTTYPILTSVLLWYMICTHFHS